MGTEERAHDFGAPGDAPETLVEEASASGVLDFELLTDELAVEWFSRTGRWPDSMRRTLRAKDLALSEAEIAEAKGSRDEATRRRREADTRIVIDDGVRRRGADYAKIVAAIREVSLRTFLRHRQSSLICLKTSRRRKNRGTEGEASRQLAALASILSQCGCRGSRRGSGGLRMAEGELPGLRQMRHGVRVIATCSRAPAAMIASVTTSRCLPAQRRLLFEVKASTGDASNSTSPMLRSCRW